MWEDCLFVVKSFSHYQSESPMTLNGSFHNIGYDGMNWNPLQSLGHHVSDLDFFAKGDILKPGYSPSFFIFIAFPMKFHSVLSPLEVLVIEQMCHRQGFYTGQIELS